MTPEQYAQAVREALADHPERHELLEDLDDHLGEIAAESDLPLEERLGPPGVYADELAAAYGERPESGGRRRTAAREWGRRVGARLRVSAAYGGFTAFLPELRPGWWVLRGYLLAMVVVSLAAQVRLVPMTPSDWAVVLAGVFASVWFGRRARSRLVVLVAVAANAVAALALFTGMVEAGGLTTPEPSPAVATAIPIGRVYVRQASSDGVYNLRPYAKDGTPLTDVYLYDQDGRPFTTTPEDYGYQVDRACGAPVLNRYPLPLIKGEAAMEAEVGAEMETPKPSACPSAAPSARPSEGPTVTATPAPEKGD
ncbi:hypothetical protein GCM10009733_052170 [Nonomuraea maheshkhaliensis]|uniref:Uncharacterized protein n=1 Tax=Nonomuraea maheshkhaliensis TaxID=419590 RepID=A0ABN2FIJ4_9ACTN